MTKFIRLTCAFILIIAIIVGVFVLSLGAMVLSAVLIPLFFVSLLACVACQEIDKLNKAK